MLTSNEIKHLKSLQAKKFRRLHGVFIAEGEKLVNDIIQSHLTVQCVYHTPQWEPPRAKQHLNTKPVGAKEMERISGLNTPSAAFAIVELPNRSTQPKEAADQLIIMLDGIQDPGNMGTIIRLADWFGIDHIVCSLETADAFAPKVVQSSMGAIARVQISYCHLPTYLNDCDGQAPIYGTFMQGENIYTSQLNRKGIIIFGSEGSGISDNLEPYITKRLRIPSFASGRAVVESLNVAMAAAIVCSEFSRQAIG